MAAHNAKEAVIAVEATGDLHWSWVAELERSHPDSVRIFAPSETRAARTQLGSARFKTDDRDCAALTNLARQGHGRRYGEELVVDALRAAVRHRRGLVIDRKVAQQRLHAQLNALCPGLSAPPGHGRAEPLASPTGLAVLGCAAAFAGRPPQLRSLSPGSRPNNPSHRRVLGAPLARMSVPAGRCQTTCPATGPTRAPLPGFASRHRSLDAEITELLAATEGQILTTLPGVAVTRAAAFAAFSLPIARFSDAEHLYSATGLAPALYQSATLHRRS